jgi:ankyrin repeat protein
MIASNFGCLEIVKILLNKGAILEDFDNYHFSPLLYAIKGGHFLTAIYLMVKKASFKDLTDNNGCSCFHWCAYNNDVYKIYIMNLGVYADVPY